MSGQEKGDLLIQLTACAGLTIILLVLVSIKGWNVHSVLTLDVQIWISSKIKISKKASLLCTNCIKVQIYNAPNIVFDNIELGTIRNDELCLMFVYLSYLAVVNFSWDRCQWNIYFCFIQGEIFKTFNW